MEIKIDITDQRVAEVLNGALDPGCPYSAYWCSVEGYREPPALTFRSDEKEVYRYVDFPLNEGGAVRIMEHGGNRVGPVYELTREKLHEGLRLMLDPAKCPARHFADILTESDDAETSDVLLQLSLLGEIRYG